MSRITDLIFKGGKIYISSSFGYRKSFKTSAGYTSSFHSGTDYATYGVKLPQYAIEDGTIISAGTDKLGGKFAWIKYPRLNVKMLHYHLDSVHVRAGQSVSRGTLIGYTGTTGRSTGIHLHLGIYDLAKGCYVNPEGFNYTEPSTKTTTTTSTGRNYYKYGDKGEYIRKLCSWYADNYYGYFCKTRKAAHNLLDGNLFGPYCLKWTKEFQRRTGLEDDGYVGPKTQAMLKSLGFNG